MLAGHRRLGARRPRRRRQHAGQGGDGHRLRHACLFQPVDQSRLADLGLGEELGIGVQVLVHDAGVGQPPRPLGAAPRGDRRPHDGIERHVVGEPQPRIGETRIRCQRRHLHRRAQALPVAIVDGQDRHPAVGRLEDAAGRAAGLHRAALEMARHQPDRLQRRGCLHQAGVEVAAARLVAAGVERRGQRLVGIERRRHVGHDHRHAVGNAVLATVLRHQAGVGLQHGIHRRPFGERPGLAEARDREVEDARHPGRHGRVVEAQPPDDARPKTLEEDVGTIEQAPHHLLAGVGLEIDGDAALAEVADDGEGCVAAIADAERARPVAFAQALDLDDLGAMLGQQHGAVGPGDALAEVDDLEPGERRVVTHPSLTSSLPKFSPRSRPMKARGALSMPSTMSSRYFSLPLLIHSPIWRIAGP